ncbi:CBS domain-containing protein [Pseudoclavibacter helvolus]|nr:CBS domain-containing protein [Pseudoclavibacter helvolus]
MATALYAHADDDAEVTARTLVDRGVLAMPIVDSENRLLGLLTGDDAHRMVEAARDEDEAHAGTSEPLRRPYLTTPVLAVVRSSTASASASAPARSSASPCSRCAPFRRP